jgi:hypothetical protein
MTVCPAELVQIASGGPLALFADGLDTAVYQLDPSESRFRQVSRVDGQLESLTASRHGESVAVVASRAAEPHAVFAGSPGGPQVRLTDTRPELRGIRWGIRNGWATGRTTGSPSTAC